MNAKISASQTDVHALILAAGLGSRLEGLTSDRPKCLVEVAGRPMLERMLDILSGERVASVTMAVGYMEERVRAFVDTLVARGAISCPVRYVRNPDFRTTGSAASFALALDEVEPSGDLVLIEADVVIEADLLSLLLSAMRERGQSATLLAPYDPALSGSFASVEAGRVTAWLHQSARAPEFDLTAAFKTINLTAFRNADRPILSDTLKAALSRYGPNVPLEYAMHDMVMAGMPIAAVLSGTRRWFEVDDARDLAIAERMFARTSAHA